MLFSISVDSTSCCCWWWFIILDSLSPLIFSNGDGVRSRFSSVWETAKEPCIILLLIIVYNSGERLSLSLAIFASKGARNLSLSDLELFDGARFNWSLLSLIVRSRSQSPIDQCSDHHLANRPGHRSQIGPPGLHWWDHQACGFECDPHLLPLSFLDSFQTPPDLPLWIKIHVIGVYWVEFCDPLHFCKEDANSKHF